MHTTFLMTPCSTAGLIQCSFQMIERHITYHVKQNLPVIMALLPQARALPPEMCATKGNLGKQNKSTTELQVSIVCLPSSSLFLTFPFCLIRLGHRKNDSIASTSSSSSSQFYCDLDSVPSSPHDSLDRKVSVNYRTNKI